MPSETWHRFARLACEAGEEEIRIGVPMMRAHRTLPVIYKTIATDIVIQPDDGEGGYVTMVIVGPDDAYVLVPENSAVRDRCILVDGCLSVKNIVFDRADMVGVYSVFALLTAEPVDLDALQDLLDASTDEIMPLPQALTHSCLALVRTFELQPPPTP